MALVGKLEPSRDLLINLILMYQVYYNTVTYSLSELAAVLAVAGAINYSSIVHQSLINNNHKQS